MRAQIAVAGTVVLLALASCATSGSKGTPGQSSATVDGGVPSTRKGLIVPSDPPMGIGGQQPTTGTESGRIGDSMGKGVGGGNTP